MEIFLKHVYLLINTLFRITVLVFFPYIHGGENNGANYLYCRNILFQSYDINDPIER